jgi:hypothetical protein
MLRNNNFVNKYGQKISLGKYDIVEREIRCCWEKNTMLLRGKYNVLINVTWDCFDQSNFYISRINIIEWNNIYYYMTINISFIRLVKSMRFCLDITWRISLIRNSQDLTLWSYNSITPEMFRNNNFVNKDGQKISFGRIHQNVGLVE